MNSHHYFGTDPSLKDTDTTVAMLSQVARYGCTFGFNTQNQNLNVETKENIEFLEKNPTKVRCWYSGAPVKLQSNEGGDTVCLLKFVIMI